MVPNNSQMKAMQIIIFGPGNETLHQDNEYVEVENYLEMVDVFKISLLTT